MTGRPECDDPRKQRCRHCGRRYTNAGITPHERNCEWSEYEGYHPSVDMDSEGSDASGSKGDPSSKSPDGEHDGAAPDRVDPHSQDSDTAESGGTPSTATDGGPQAPPMPSTPATDADQDAVDDDRVPTDADELPERFVAVDDFIDSVRSREMDDQDADAVADALAMRLSNADIVDIERTTVESVKPHKFEELTDYV